MERREISIVRASSSALTRCEVCGSDSGMVRGEDAAAAFAVKFDVVREWLLEGRIHGHTVNESELLICAQSLKGLLGKV
jgi:hypothetical protein